MTDALHADPWRAVCPNGHSGWETRVSGYYCQSCESRFERLHDLKEDDVSRSSKRGGPV